MNNRNGRGPLAMAMGGAALALGMCAGVASGQAWTNPLGGVWSNPDNWDEGVPSMFGDVATIAFPGQYTVLLDISVQLSGFHMANPSATLQGAGGSMEVVDTLFENAALESVAGYFSLGTLTFAGDICDDLTDTPLEHTGSMVDWVGEGDILLGGSTVFTHGDAPGHHSVFNIENTSTMFGGGTLINNGKISKNSGGTTTFSGISFVNNGAVCVLDGELRIVEGGIVGPALDNGHWEVSGGSTLSMVGVQFDSIGGGASVTLDGAESTFEAIDTITSIGPGSVFQVRNGRNFTTIGSLAVGGQLVIGQPLLAPSTFNVSGGLTNNGNVHLGNGTLVVSGVHTISEEGSVTGNGLHAGDMENNGLVSPGEDTETLSSPGQLVVRGNYTQGAAGRLLIEIAGRQPGLEHDVFHADEATLRGALEIVLVPGFVPDRGDTFQVFTFGGVSGEFDRIDGLMQRGITFEAVFTPTSLQLVVIDVPAPGVLPALGLAVLAGARRRRP